jgi:hypothetical protein
VCASRCYIEDKKSLRYHNPLAVAVVPLVIEKEARKVALDVIPFFFLTDSLQTRLINRSFSLEFLLAVRGRVAGHGERQGDRESLSS